MNSPINILLIALRLPRKLALLLLVVVPTTYSANVSPGSPLPDEVQTPTYQLVFDNAELDLFLNILRSGIERDGDGGGRVKFDVRLVKNNNQAQNIITIDDQVVVNAINVWMSVYASESENNSQSKADTDSENGENKIADAVLSKFKDAIINPIYKRSTRTGRIEIKDEQAVLKTSNVEYTLRNFDPTLNSLWIGKEIVGYGVIREPGVFDLMHFYEKPRNTLEIFVISQCPFGKMAEVALIDRVNSLPEESRPILNFRYIFYKRTDQGEYFTCLHGEEEVVENLVQMQIRDRYSESYHNYLLTRAKSESPWDELAVSVGLSTEQVNDIKQTIQDQRDELIRAEYEYATLKYGVFDGSPTFVWEGQIVTDITSVDLFAGIDLEADGQCGSDENE